MDPLWRNLVLALIDAYKQVDEDFAWISWGQDAAFAIQQGKAPPPSPVSPSIFKRRLEAQAERLAALRIPPFQSDLPSTGRVPTNGFDVTRAAIRERMTALQNCVIEVSDGRDAIENFKQFEEALAQQQEMLRKLVEVLWNLATDFPGGVISELLAFGAIDVENSYIPTIRDMADRVETKRRAAETALVSRLQLIKAAAGDLRNVLVAEAFDLNAQLEKLQKLDEEVGELQQKYASAVNARDQAATEAARCQQVLKTAQTNVTGLQGQLYNAKNSLQSITDQINIKQAAYNKPYLCPSKADWENCTIQEHIPIKNAYVANRISLAKDIVELGKRRTEANTVVDDVTRNLNAARDIVSQSLGNSQVADTAKQAADSRLGEAKTMLADKARQAQEERWKNRADVFSPENAADQQEVQATIGKLDRP